MTIFYLVMKLFNIKEFTVLQTKLFPTIYIYWQKYQKKLLEKVKSMSSGIVLAGDGRHDSMGHSAKYGVSMIIHFALVQVCLNSQLSNEK